MGFAGEAVDDFDFIFGDTSSDVDTKGYTGEVGVLEFNAGALVAVVEENVEAGGGEAGGDLFAGFEKRRFADVGDGNDDLEGRDGG